MKKWIALLFFLASYAYGSPADLLADKNISESFARLNNDEVLDPVFKKVILNAWDTKCADLDYPKIAKCYLNECDLGIPSCNASKVLLFRGEAEKYAYTGASSALRNTLNGLELGASAKTTSELLKIIVDHIKIGHFDREQLRTDEDLMLLNKNGKYSWHLLPSGMKFREFSDKTQTKATYAEIMDLNTKEAPRGRSEKLGTLLYDAQSLGGSAFSVLDPKLYLQDISVLVSLTTNPYVADDFASRSRVESRFIVLSVPKSDIKSNCSSVYPPGTIVRYNQCIKREGDETQAMEIELNSTLFIAPQYILKSFRID